MAGDDGGGPDSSKAPLLGAPLQYPNVPLRAHPPLLFGALLTPPSPSPSPVPPLRVQKRMGKAEELYIESHGQCEKLIYHQIKFSLAYSCLKVIHIYKYLHI